VLARPRIHAYRSRPRQRHQWRAHLNRNRGTGRRQRRKLRRRSAQQQHHGPLQLSVRRAVTGRRVRRALLAAQSALAPATLTTLPHFSVSKATSAPNSAAVVGIASPPSSAKRARKPGMARTALTAWLSAVTTSRGVPFGA